MKHLLIATCLAASSTLLWPNLGLAACSINLHRMIVPKEVRATVPYKVTMPFEEEGQPELIDGHFWRDDEGPFKVRVIKGEAIEAQLFTGEPRTYKLTAQIIYRCGNDIKQSNQVSSPLVVNANRGAGY